MNISINDVSRTVWNSVEGKTWRHVNERFPFNVGKVYNKIAGNHNIIKNHLIDELEELAIKNE